MVTLPPVSQALTQMGIPHRVFTHPGPVNSLEQAAAERGQVPAQVIRSILFRLGESNFLMALMAGPAQVSWPALRSYLGISRISMATEEEVFTCTGYRTGAVSPFGLPAPLRIIADDSIFVHDQISIGSGERGTTVIMDTKDLKKALGDIEITSLALK